ncbi:condensation domain-containing protein [Actinoplanes sp. NPDC051346]|uniref:condensation domain-containing protein n=1 Tax=Actinoplanes sp. NPDC051346 TaxID=3155048 RepID=UPI00343F5FE9
MKAPIDVAAVAVTVSGCRWGQAPATWGQANILRILAMLRERAHSANLSECVPLPPGTSVAAATAWIRKLLITFEALRTRYVERDGGWEQILDGAGSLEVELVTTDGQDVMAAAEAEIARLRATPFDLARRWPVRFSLLLRDGYAAGLTFACSHAVSDAWGVRALRTALAMPGGPVDPGVQPLDQAGFETSPAGLRLDERAAEYWRTQLTAMPRTLFPKPGRSAHEGVRFWYAKFDSPVLSAALPYLARRFRTNTSVVLYGAFAAALAANAGVDGCPIGLVAANRSRPGTRTALAPYSQLVPAVVPVSGRDWGAIITGAAGAALTAFRYSASHPRTAAAVTAEVAQSRGVHLDLSLWFNDTRATYAAADGGFDPARPPTAGVADWHDRTDRGDSTVFVYVHGDAAHPTLNVMVDTVRLSRPDAERLLADVEQGLLDAAGTRSAGSLPASVRWRPSGSGWVRVDGSWVNLPAVEGLVRDCGDWSDVRVRLDGQRLIADVTPRGGVPDLEAVRRAGLARLPLMPEAIVPHQFALLRR